MATACTVSVAGAVPLLPLLALGLRKSAAVGGENKATLPMLLLLLSAMPLGGAAAAAGGG